MNILSLLTSVVYAAELIISPLPSDGIVVPTPQIKPSLSFSQLPTPTLAVREVLGLATASAAPSVQTTKKFYTVALLGDSMIDTLGGLTELKDALHIYYPDTAFALLNYGVGGTNIDYGLERLTHSYTYLNQDILSLVSQHPDLIVVESFGYNPYSYDEGALERHWLTLARIVDVVKKELPDASILIASTIAPDARVFGDGAPGLAFDQQGKNQKVDTIKKYLENAVRFAASQKLPVADAYHPSLDESGNGRGEFINGGDHIHYSEEGRKFFSKKIADAIVANQLLK